MNILSSDISSVPQAIKYDITSTLEELVLTLSTMSLSFLKFSKPFLNFFGIPSCKNVKSFMITAGENKINILVQCTRMHTDTLHYTTLLYIHSTHTLLYIHYTLHYTTHTTHTDTTLYTHYTYRHYTIHTLYIQTLHNTTHTHQTLVYKCYSFFFVS